MSLGTIPKKHLMLISLITGLLSLFYFLSLVLMGTISKVLVCPPALPPFRKFQRSTVWHFCLYVWLTTTKQDVYRLFKLQCVTWLKALCTGTNQSTERVVLPLPHAVKFLSYIFSVGRGLFACSLLAKHQELILVRLCQSLACKTSRYFTSRPATLTPQNVRWSFLQTEGWLGPQFILGICALLMMIVC